MPYNVGATKAMANMKKEYGAAYKSIYFALANKRSGRGLRGKHRGHVAANAAYAKGRTWGGKGKKAKGVNVRTRGKANVTRRSGGHSVRIHVH